MKKKLLLAIFIAALAFGCKKAVVDKKSPDNEKSDTVKSVDTAKTLVGTWYVKSDTLKYYTAGKQTSNYVTNLDHYFYLIFRADGTGLQFAVGGNTNFTYSLSTKMVTINYSEQNSQGEITPAYTRAFMIKALDDSNLYLLFDDIASHNTAEAIVFTK